MADQTEQMNRLLDPNSAVREGEMEYSYQVDDRIEQMTPSQMAAARASGEIVANPETQMIESAQMGLMQLDPEGTKDVVDGLEMSKQKVMAGGALTEAESSGIMAILQKISGALKGLMSGGETKTYFVDGRPVEMTEREVMGARNSGILVQDFETGMADIDNPRWNINSKTGE